MKGLAIHVEQLIVIIIAVLILLAVITFFLGLWDPRWIGRRQKLNEACQLLQNAGCATEVLTPGNYETSIKASEVGGSGPNTLDVQEVCDYVLTGKLGGATPEQCLKACACAY